MLVALHCFSRPVRTGNPRTSTYDDEQKKVTRNGMENGHSEASTAESFTAGQPHSSVPAAEAAWVSAAVLKPAPKAEETVALLLVFVSRSCHMKISFFGSFCSKRLAVGNWCHEVVVCRR